MMVSTTNLRRRLAELEMAIVEQAVEQKAARDKLEQHRIAVEAELNATATFPVLRLPVEITTEVFSLCLPTIEEQREDSRVRMSEKLRSEAPTLFLGVCQAWRDIALATPALWATLYIRFDIIGYGVASELGKVEGFIDRWLDRAALLPLLIALCRYTVEEDGFADGPFTPMRMRDLIHRYAHRTQYLELNFSQYEMRQLELDSVLFPLLQRVALGDKYGPEPDRLDPVLVFTNTPQLRDLDLIVGGVFSYYTPPSLQLTKFDSEIDDLKLFTLAPNLAEARCAMTYLYSTVQTSIILHPRLQSLTLCASPDFEKPIDILQHLTLPALQSLHISEMEDTAYPSLQPFLTRSSPPLLTLSIRADDEDFHDLEECFSCVNDTLENLELVSPSKDVQLTILRIYYPHFPHLQTLSLVDAFGIDYGALVGYLEKKTI
ncbi:hypothetical protein C8R44DRAFT_872497 [Mycena epipterygia]|nr:hypothetical protein C8R44DRAFT_872497 [Mycena epipterygia]